MQAETRDIPVPPQEKEASPTNANPAMESGARGAVPQPYMSAFYHVSSNGSPGILECCMWWSRLLVGLFCRILVKMPARAVWTIFGYIVKRCAGWIGKSFESRFRKNFSILNQTSI